MLMQRKPGESPAFVGKQPAAYIHTLKQITPPRHDVPTLPLKGRVEPRNPRPAHNRRYRLP